MLIFRETKLSSSNIKKAFLIFRETETPKQFLIFQETETRKKIFIFQEVTFRARKMKIIYSEKMSYILGNGTF